MIRTSLIVLTVLVLLPLTLFGQVNAALNVYDAQGVLYTAPDNSTVFPAAPGAYFVMEITGAPFAPFSLFMALKGTPYPTSLTPPPLFLMPPILPVLAGGDFILDVSGRAQFTGTVPPELGHMAGGLDIYFQGFVQDPVNGFELTNGILMSVIPSVYRASVAVAQGTSLQNLTRVGLIHDGDAGDNQALAGGGLGQGEPLVTVPDFVGKVLSLKDDITPTDLNPNPSTSIYLNGQFPLVPGDTGLADMNEFTQFPQYPEMGSSPYILTRDRICRNNENRFQQHIIVPRFDGDGQKIADLSIHPFQDPTTGEFGFLVADAMNGDLYELKGTRMTNAYGDHSPWDPYVTISPDGLFMAAVLKNRSGDIKSGKDKLYVIKLGKDEVWSTGLHARQVKLNDPQNQKYVATRIFAELLTFGGDPAHILFFVCNRYDTLAVTDTEPPIEQASVLWRTWASKETGPHSVGKYFNHTELPMVGDNLYTTTYFGSPLIYDPPSKSSLSDQVWLTSAKHDTLVFRAAGRYAEWDGGSSSWKVGGWKWDVFSITEIQGIDDFQVKNITGFPEYGDELGFEVDAFRARFRRIRARRHQRRLAPTWPACAEMKARIRPRSSISCPVTGRGRRC